MVLSEIKSKAELSRFVESYWYFDGAQKEDFLVVPDGTFHVWVAVSGFSIGNQIYPSGIYVAPIGTKPYSVKSETTLYGIRFKAFAMPNILGKNVQQITRIESLYERVAGNDLHVALLRDFSKLKEIASALDLLESLAFELLNKRYSVNESLRAQVNYMLDRKGELRISEMCDELGITRQGLHKSFTQQLGISPKELATIWKLNNFLLLLSQGESLTATAIDAGYYDQAHCIHSFKNCWNLAPGNLRKINPGLVEFATQSIHKRFTNFYDPEI